MIFNHVPKVAAISSWLNKKTGNFRPQAAIIMGSGLSQAVPGLAKVQTISYDKIPGFLRSTVPGHAGELMFGEYNGVRVVIMRGRFHFYEGYNISDIAIPIRVLGKLGVKTLIITSAVGSVHTNLKPGSLVILKDHINFMGRNPLGGAFDASFGPMFPDMTEPYDPQLRKLALSLSRQVGIKAREGVYMAGVGPSYETKAEIQAFKNMGADVVGMSVVPEVITARQMDVRVLALASVTNLASGVAKTPLSHQEVMEEGKKAALKMKALLEKILSSKTVRG
ncbi:MAG: purine-nucleoside phosphorylase [Elusimicrobia bacterium]|nr:purine-nucleoside phosphorylase [Elusimicrobiota bacterium]